MEIPTMRDSADVFSSAENGQQRQLHPRSPEELDEEDDEEQLEMYVNDILGGVADIEEVGSGSMRG